MMPASLPLKLSVLLGFATVFVAPLAHAAEPDPTYSECFTLAENAIKAEMVGVEMEADELAGTLPEQGLATPADLPKSSNATIPNTLPNTLPGMQGNQDFEQALREQGVRIVIDPEDPTGAPKVELDNVRLNAEGMVEMGQAPVADPDEPEEIEEVAKEKASEEAEEAPKELSNAEIFQMQRTVCRIKYGITF